MVKGFMMEHEGVTLWLWKARIPIVLGLLLLWQSALPCDSGPEPLTNEDEQKIKQVLLNEYKDTFTVGLETYKDRLPQYPVMKDWFPDNIVRKKDAPAKVVQEDGKGEETTLLLGSPSKDEKFVLKMWNEGLSEELILQLEIDLNGKNEKIQRTRKPPKAKIQTKRETPKAKIQRKRETPGGANPFTTTLVYDYTFRKEGKITSGQSWSAQLVDYLSPGVSLMKLEVPIMTGEVLVKYMLKFDVCFSAVQKEQRRGAAYVVDDKQLFLGVYVDGAVKGSVERRVILWKDVQIRGQKRVVAVRLTNDVRTWVCEAPDFKPTLQLPDYVATLLFSRVKDDKDAMATLLKKWEKAN